ncbi:hypothetical protein ACFVMC_13060 [Nocardia sp. NPDC127579]|uniref:hypothetical protein n=1 Tax=Nocardia sp. NPDC127579 TaxID=3345402 RepID=UPI003644D36D
MTVSCGVVYPELSAVELSEWVAVLVSDAPTPELDPPTTPPTDSFAAALDSLHRTLAHQDPLKIADDLPHELRARAMPPERARWVARDLVIRGCHRNVVALGMAMLGAVGDHRDRELLLLLGALDDLARYACDALARTQPDPDRAIFELARRVDGRGRIQTVQRLRGCADSEIKAWLLREGFRNSISDGLLAHIAAETGELGAALLDPDVDDALLDAAGGILEALTSHDVSAPDIRSYPDARSVLDRYADLVDRRLEVSGRSTIPRLRCLYAVDRMLNQQQVQLDWPAEEVRRLAERYAELLTRPAWSELVRTELQSGEGQCAFNQALDCAQVIGVEAYPVVLTHLEREPRNRYAWNWAIRNTPLDGVDALIELAERVLPLDEMACGPGSTGSLAGSGRIDESILQRLLLMLRCGTVGSGLRLIETGLFSSSPRSRRTALRVLSRWPAQHVPVAARAAVVAAARVEPEEKLRAEMLTFTGGIPTEVVSITDGAGVIDVRGESDKSGWYSQSLLYLGGCAAALDTADYAGSVGRLVARAPDRPVRPDGLDNLRELTTTGRIAADLADTLEPLLNLLSNGTYELRGPEPISDPLRVRYDDQPADSWWPPKFAWYVIDPAPDDPKPFYPVNEDLITPTEPWPPTDSTTIDRYRRLIREGGRPALITLRAGGDNIYSGFILDGHHKLAAYLLEDVTPRVIRIARLDPHPFDSGELRRRFSDPAIQELKWLLQWLDRRGR